MAHKSPETPVLPPGKTVVGAGTSSETPVKRPCEGEWLENHIKSLDEYYSKPGNKSSGEHIRIICAEGEEAEVDRGDGNFDEATAGMQLERGGKVVTGFDSKVVLYFAGRGVVIVKEMTNFDVRDYLFTQNGITAKTDMKVGEVDVKVDRTYKEVDFSVSTPTCIAGVRGTEFTISHQEHPMKSTVTVYSGKVEVAPKVCSVRARTLSAGECISVDKNCFGKLKVFEPAVSGKPLKKSDTPNKDMGRPKPVADSYGDITKTTGTGSTGLTLDFETGRTNGWTKTGTAFDYQPTYGDNPTARRRGQPSKHVGNYWIGTYEKYQGYGSQTPGSVQGDRPTGTLTSNVFTISTGSLSFLVGGGSSFQTRVELLVSGNSVLSVSGRNTETMHRVKWGLNPWAGQQGQIRLVDNASGGWGHINADDFRFSHSTPPQPDVKNAPSPDPEPQLKPLSEDGYQSIGRVGALDSGRQGDSSERQRKLPEGHSTKYGF